MKLSKWLEKEGIRAFAFSQNIGKPHPTVYRWINGKAIPRNENMRLIMDVTGGEVSANDFL